MSKKAILFPGQGSQFFKMGLDFYNEYEEYKKIIDLAVDKVSDLKDVMYENETEKLNDTLYAQFAISSMELGIYNIIKNKLDIDGVAGFSLGEYAALNVSNVIELSDIFEVINLRTKYMTKANVDGGMIAVLRTSYDEIKKCLDELESKGINCYIANYNTGEQIVLSCKNEVINNVVEFLKENGIKKAIPLKVSGPFHSTYYKEAAKLFKNSLNDINFNKPEIDLYLNTSGTIYKDENLKEVCEKQMHTQVNWYLLIQQMIEDDYSTFIEVGPGQVLSGFMKKINKDVKIINVQSVDDLKNLEEL